uniref:50S small subunit ribosomal protein L31 n=1 Tax=Kwoniella bestiolae CBS 10118 TaxID=1296100 RepID=A0A1B9FWE3_9TREE|nr:50S small subunit ribosomal protein L31 [Kwoniella bestiolae CBS 10118]OCF23080.1 50S small subunit ribosomal protein L31 [Kwoniella bestiolae CBS 10118]
MFGAFRPSSILSGGLLWKTPWRLSPTRKANQRKRLKQVDSVISAVAQSGITTRSLERALALPMESEMNPRGEL